MTYEYGVVIRKQKKGEPTVWQFWIGAGCLKEHSSFLAVMDWAGARGFEAFAAGNFDELEVPEVLMRRALVAAPPPPLPKTTGKAGAELGAAAGAAPKAKAKAKKSSGSAR